MAKKSTGNILGLLAFLVVIFTAVVALLNTINSLLNTSIPTGTLNLVSEILLNIVLLWCGWTFASRLPKFWKYLYLALVILIAVRLIFGWGLF